MMLAQPVAAFGLGDGRTTGIAPVAPSSPSGAPVVRGTAAFPIQRAGFFRSAEFGLILALIAVAYVDGRVLPRTRS